MIVINENEVMDPSLGKGPSRPPLRSSPHITESTH